MKTVKQVQKEADALRKQMNEAGKAERKRLNRQLLLLKTCQYYLETAPRPAFVRAQLDDITVRLGVIRSRFGAWCAHKTGGKNELQRQYNSLNEVDKLKAQVKTQKYLLGD